MQTELYNSYNLVLDTRARSKKVAPLADKFLSPLISPGLCAGWC